MVEQPDHGWEFGSTRSPPNFSQGHGDHLNVWMRTSKSTVNEVLGHGALGSPEKSDRTLLVARDGILHHEPFQQPLSASGAPTFLKAG